MRKADNLPPSCDVVTKSGNLNFLEPSGPLQACNGTALAFFYYVAVPFVVNYNLLYNNFTSDFVNPRVFMKLAAVSTSLRHLPLF